MQPSHIVAWNSDACNVASRNFFGNTRRTLESSRLWPRYLGYMEFQNRTGEMFHACLRNDLGSEPTLVQSHDACMVSLETRQRHSNMDAT